jgi:hypothetical protein
MDKVSNVFSLLLVVILAVSSLMMIESANAQTIPKPSIPEFTLKLVDNSFKTSSATQIQNGRIETVIKNQPFTPYLDAKGNEVYLDYNLECRGLSETGETILRNISKYQSTSEFTTLTVYYGEASNSIGPFLGLGYLQWGSEIEIRVNTQIGYRTQVEEHPDVYGGNISDWSNTQTITIPSNEQSPTPTVPEFLLLAIIPLMVSMLSVAAVFRHRKTTKINQ